MEFNPCRGIERNPEYPRDRYVSTQEMKALQACCPEWLALYLDLKYITGLRQSDLLKLRLEDFGPTGLSLTISKTGRGAQRRGQQRVLFKMNPALHSLGKIFEERQQCLATIKCQSRTTLLFSTATGNLRRYNEFKTAWQRAWRRLWKTTPSMSYFTEHDVRAKTATDANSSGLDATHLLVHNDKRTTKAHLCGRLLLELEPLPAPMKSLT